MARMLTCYVLSYARYSLTGNFLNHNMPRKFCQQLFFTSLTFRIENRILKIHGGIPVWKRILRKVMEMCFGAQGELECEYINRG